MVQIVCYKQRGFRIYLNYTQDLHLVFQDLGQLTTFFDLLFIGIVDELAGKIFFFDSSSRSSSQLCLIIDLLRVKSRDSQITI